MKRIKCPCCGNFTIEDSGEEVIVDICPVCYWQYDIVGQEKVTISIGPNKVSLNEAKENYIKFGASTQQLKQFVRKVNEHELAENN